MEAQIEMIQEMFNKDLEETKNRLTISNEQHNNWKKNTLEGTNSRITEA